MNLTAFARDERLRTRLARALDFTGAAGRAAAPVVDLLVRLALAKAFFAPAALAGFVPFSTMLPTLQDGMLPSQPLIIGAVLLALGLGTPMAAAVRFVAGTGMAMAGSDHGVTIYEPLLLALLGTSGAGRYSLDHLIGCWARRAVRLPSDLPHVVIVGAGFGGMACAERLPHEPAHVTVIDRENYHLFQPLLYPVATAALSPADITTPANITTPVRAAFRDNARMRVLRDAVTAVDTAARQVIADSRAIAYDMLVLATGATHGYFGQNGRSSRRG